jgi:signal transduction histidine kinase
MKLSRSRCFSGLCLVFFLIFPGILCAAKDGVPFRRAVNGILDLSGVEMERSVIGCQGEWIFYPNILAGEITESGLAVLHSDKLTVPGQWNHLKSAGRWKDGTGAGTYRLNVTGVRPGEKYGIMMMDAFSFRLYVDGRLIASNGRVSLNRADYKAQALPTAAYFTASTDRLDIRAEVANFDNNWGGIWQEVRFGKAGVIENYQRGQLIQDGILLGIMLSLGLFHLILYFLRRKDKSTLFFGLFTLAVFLHCLFINQQPFFQLFPGADFTTFNRTSYFFITLMLLFFVSYFGNLFPKVTSRLITGIIHTACLMEFVLIFLLPYHTMTVQFVAFHVVIVLASLYLLIVVVRAIMEKLPDAKIFLVGLIIIVGFTVNDILYGDHIIESVVLFNWGIAIFLFFQSLLIARKSALAFETSEKLSSDLEIRVAERTRELEARVKERDRIISVMSHDLRTPLALVISMLDFIGMANEQGNREKVAQQLKKANERSRSALGLMDQLLDWAKIIRLPGKPEPKDINVYDIFQAVVFLMQEQADRKTIVLEIDNPGVIRIYSDPKILETILRNLVANALKFTPEGGRIIIGAEKAGGEVRIRVQDSGIGMSSETAAALFRNGVVSRDGTAGEKGIGLGLILCRELAELIGGTLYAAGEEGKGSVFTFVIPVPVAGA